jgi:hypothetical protein
MSVDRRRTIENESVQSNDERQSEGSSFVASTVGFLHGQHRSSLPDKSDLVDIAVDIDEIRKCLSIGEDRQRETIGHSSHVRRHERSMRNQSRETRSHRRVQCNIDPHPHESHRSQ